MHLLRLFLATWIEFGIVTFLFLYWLVKRTAQRINRLDKPVLDQNTFQQLLAAAHTLQEQNHSLVKETKADACQTVSLRVEPAQMPQSDLEPLASLNDSMVPISRARTVRRPTPQSEVFFWRIAATLAMAAVSALLLVASSDRFSPLPSQLLPPSDVVQQPVPFWRTTHVVTDLPQGSTVVTKTVMMEPKATKTGPNGRTLDAHKPRRSVPAATHKKIVSPIRHSIYESEADMVAPDTVVRYGRRAVRR
jgi:hypothetical protein